MTNRLKKLVLPALFIVCSIQIQAQGCVAIRHFSNASGTELASNLLQKGEMQFSMNYRYFKSFRHFKGTEENPDRLTNNSEVINHSHAWDYTINYGLNSRSFASIVIPTVINSRSSLYEHGRTERHQTFSRGLSDLRLQYGYWLFNPETHLRGNALFSFGLKLPTGNFNATDLFYNVGPDGTPQVRPVDQSIQPGDGGFGFSLDLQHYSQLTERWFMYVGGFYLFNPKNTNGVRTFRETLSSKLSNEAIMSVPDQFSFRAGVSYAISPISSLSLGTLYQGVPVEDMIGKSEAFRRPGNVLSVDPGYTYSNNKVTLNLSVPIALRRERPQSVTDREIEIATGKPRNGDAAFADYLINFGVVYKLINKKESTVSTYEFKSINN